MAKLLEVKDLQVRFHTPEGIIHAVESVNISLDEGETLAIVGESGCGKSVTARSIMRLIAPPGKIEGGSITFKGKDILALDDSELRQFRGGEVAMIFQEPMTSLNPVFSVKDQLVEAIMIHQKVSKKEAVEKAIRLLEITGIPSPAERIENYPHQLSGGMRQRVMIAMGLSCKPRMLIADEPTTALDVTIQAQILQIMRDLKKEFGMAIMLITHDMGVVAEMAERVAIMYAGRIVENRSVNDLFADPQHPYTEGLMNSIPGLDETSDRLHVIKGNVPNLLDLPQGCSFYDRCPYGIERCRTEVPALEKVNGNLEVACFNYRDLRKNEGAEVISARHPYSKFEKNEKDVLIKVENLTKQFRISDNSFFAGKKTVHAVDNVSFSIMRGETFGLVGESGSGKTTTGRVILGLEEATSGKVFFDGRSLFDLSPVEQKKLREKAQIIFQDPYSSLNPRMRIETIIGEGLRIHSALSKKEKDEKIISAMKSVGLEDYHADRYPHEFSGGQRQRIGIARALVLDPEFIVCDEPVSALDVSIQAQILNLLKDLQQSHNLTYLFIAHNLSVVRHICDRIGVMYLGNLMEVAEAEELNTNPLHPYTKALLSAAPRPDPQNKSNKIILEGDIPSPIYPPSGCRFRTRCMYAKSECATAIPEMKEVSKGHFVSCLFV